MPDVEGHLYFRPGGALNLLPGKWYRVPDDRVARRIDAIAVPCEYGGIVLALACGLAALALDLWQPRHGAITPLVLAALVIGPLLASLSGFAIARLLSLERCERPVKIDETREGWNRRIGPGWLLAFVAATAVLALAIVVIASGDSLAQRTGLAPPIALLAAVVAATMAPILVFERRARRLAEANTRLERIVLERTAQLVNANRILESRVEEQLAHLARLGQLRHFFAAPVAEMILGQSGFDPSRVHRKELSVISIDLKGFTAFAETSEPEEVIGVLRTYHAELGRLVNLHRATLEHFSGENAMVFLNDPIDIPGHPQRALELAVALRETTQAMLADWRRQGFDLGLGAGIATGYATMGAIGYEGRWEYAAIGSVCNLAARLCAEARDGQVVTTHRVLSRLDKQPRLEPLGELALKGITRPVTGFNVVALA